MQEKTTPKQRNLTQKQLDVLKLLYRFRFGTSDLIARAQGGVSRQSTNIRLASLVKGEYVIKKQTGRDRIQGKPAVYRLGAKGRAVLRKEGSKYSEKVLNTIRANRDNSDHFVQRQLTIFKIFNDLTAKYGDTLVLLAKSNMAADKFHYLPEVKPDALIYHEGTDKYFFVFLLDDSMPDFALVRRIAPIFEYEKSGKWEAATKTESPRILLACNTKRIETVMRKRVARLHDDARSDLILATSTLDRMNSDATPWKGMDSEQNATLVDL
jgi:DNA-binding MarR family transcriptional regulator